MRYINLRFTYLLTSCGSSVLTLLVNKDCQRPNRRAKTLPVGRAKHPPKLAVSTAFVMYGHGLQWVHFAVDGECVCVCVCGHVLSGHLFINDRSVVSAAAAAPRHLSFANKPPPFAPSPQPSPDDTPQSKQDVRTASEAHKSRL